MYIEVTVRVRLHRPVITVRSRQGPSAGQRARDRTVPRTTRSTVGRLRELAKEVRSDESRTQPDSTASPVLRDVDTMSTRELSNARQGRKQPLLLGTKRRLLSWHETQTEYDAPPRLSVVRDLNTGPTGA